ncbi:MAG: TRAP transporter substrate-binding protein [Zhengella sp.]|uniref:TRAP transporter substrate-binding protein n=1 Tax=Zhengella sp. TaxID=2282762 RepID=UPI003528166B
MKPVSLKSLALAAIVGAGAVMGTSVASFAQEVTLKLHQFLPAQANVPKYVLDVWADKVEEQSGNRIKVERYPSMQLGGKPPELIDQVRDGVVDVVWTVIGYTPGRFPRTEVFELPFMVTTAEPASRAFWEMFEKDMKDEEFKDVHIIGGWVHGPGVIHANKEVRVPSDLNGMKIRGASRTVNMLLEELGATPVGMPVPAVPEALSKGVIDGTTIPWEVTAALKVPELVKNHTEFTGRALYTVTFVLAMNKAKYESLPDDLKKVIDDNSGMEFSAFAGKTQEYYDGPARELAVKANNNIVTLNEEETAAWREAAQPVYDKWIADMNAKGYDGQALVNEAEALIKKYSGQM